MLQCVLMDTKRPNFNKVDMEKCVGAFREFNLVSGEKNNKRVCNWFKVTLRLRYVAPR